MNKPELNSHDLAENLTVPPHATLGTLPDERRLASRFQRDEGTDFAVVWRQPGEAITVEVHDESVNGLGILLDGGPDFRLGCQVKVAYAGEELQAEVRHITWLADGKQLVGLRCFRQMA